MRWLPHGLRATAGKLAADSFLRNASVTSLCQVLGVAAGFALDAGILALFGLGRETDAYFAAMAIPLIVTNTFEVQVPKVLIPLFAGSSGKSSREAGEVLWQLLLVASLLAGAASAAAVAFSGALIGLQVPGLSRETLALSVQVAEIAFWLLLLRGVTTILRCRLYSDQRFVLASSKKALANAVAVAVLLAFYSQWGIQAVVAGLLAGEALAALAMLAALAARGAGPRPSLAGLHPDVRKLGRLLLYPMASHLVGESRTLVENFVLSFLGSGALSALRYASRIIQAVSGILVGGIMTTTLPTLSQLAAQSQLEAMKEMLLRGIRLLATAALPISIWLAVASHPLLMLLYGRGEFSASDAVLPAALITWLTPYILLSRLSGLMQVPFMSVLELRTPFWSTLLSLAVHVAVLLALTGPIGIWAFPAAAALSSAASLGFLSRAFLKRFGSIDWAGLGSFARRLGGAGALCAAGCAAGIAAPGVVTHEWVSSDWVLAALPALVGGAAFLAAIAWTGLIDLLSPSPGGEHA